jgi:hypothetical protein
MQKRYNYLHSPYKNKSPDRLPHPCVMTKVPSWFDQVDNKEPEVDLLSLQDEGARTQWSRNLGS